MRSMTLGCWLLAAVPLVAAPKTDLYGDPLPEGAVCRIGATVKLLHDDSVCGRVFWRTPGGSSPAACMANGGSTSGMWRWAVAPGSAADQRR